MVFNKYSSNDHYDTFIHVKVEENRINKEIYDLCNRIFDSNRLYNRSQNDQIEQVVRYIRTIFKDYKITDIIVNLKSKYDYTSVTIEDNKVVKFQKKSVKDFGPLNFNYNKKGIILDTENYDFNEISYNEKDFNEHFNHCMKTMYNLNYSTVIELGNIEKEIIIAYKDFFGKYPDFSNENDYLKVQSMMWLCSIEPDSKYYKMFGDFSMRYNGKPTSFILKNSVDNIVPYGQIDESLNFSTYKDSNYIVNMGKIVTDYISRYKDSQEILDNIARVSYIKNRMVPKHYEIDDIVFASKDNLNYEQVEEIDDFLVNLNTALISDDFFNTYKELEKDNSTKVKTKK